MPSSVRLSPTRILMIIGRKEGLDHFIDAWVTDDNGKNWTFLNKPAESTGGSVGNPPSMISPEGWATGDHLRLPVCALRNPRADQH